MDSFAKFGMKCDSNIEKKIEESEDPLDIQYRNSLSIIRRLINSVNTTFSLNQYRVWLEKISTVSDEQKELRNKYMLELAKQLQNKRLKFPFTEPPPEGDLVPAFERPLSPSKCVNSVKALKKDLFMKEFSKEEIDFLENSDNESWVDLTSEESNISVKKSRSSSKRKKVQGKFNENNNTFNSDNNAPIKSENVLSAPKTIVQPVIPSLENNKNINGITKTTTQNLKQEIKPINIEEGSSFMRSDWKSIIETLQQRLTDTLQENAEVKKLVNTLRQQKIEDEKRFQDNLIKCNEGCKKTIVDMEIKHAAEIKNLQSHFNTELGHMEEVYRREIADFTNNSQQKINSMKCDYDKIVQEKDAEIKRLNELVDNKCCKISDEICGLTNHINEIMDHTSTDDRIVFLQKCVTKMDKLFQKAEKEHVKEIQKLQHELDFKEKLCNIKMHTLKTELIAKNSNEKQTQFDGLVSNLETRYKKILDIQEIQLAEVRKHYENKISKLISYLNSNNIYYDSEEFQ